MSKSSKFTIEVEGLDIPERYRAEISKALNQTLMHKLGEIDMSGNGHKTNASGAPEASGGSFWVNEYLINGGRILSLLGKNLPSVIDQVAKQRVVEGSFGINVTQAQSFQNG